MSAEQTDSQFRAWAVKLLARREYARSELNARLLARGADAAAIERVLDALEAQGLLSEARFTEQYVGSMMGRGHGPLRIHEELCRRGIDAEAANEALDPHAAVWSGQASRERARRFGEAAPVECREWARQARFLERRGFTPEQIRSALGRSPWS